MDVVDTTETKQPINADIGNFGTKNMQPILNDRHCDFKPCLQYVGTVHLFI